jgi:hypothetical protein
MRAFSWRDRYYNPLGNGDRACEPVLSIHAGEEDQDRLKGSTMKLSKREERSKRHKTGKRGVYERRCTGNSYFEKVVGTRKLPDGRMVNVIRGYSKYLHFTKGWRKRAATGVKYELAA